MKLTFHPDLIARTPHFPLEDLYNARLADILDNPDFREALYIASPALAAQVFDSTREISEELKLTVWRYFNRMCFRCTPYGIFAGCGKATWSDKTSVIRKSIHTRRRTRLDKEYFVALVKKMEVEKKLFFRIKLSLNNTLYQVGDQIRMIESSGRGADFQIAAFPLNELMIILWREYTGRNFSAQELIDRGILLGFTKKAVSSYLLRLFDDGIIKSEFEVSLPTNELLDHYIEILSRLKQCASVKHWVTQLIEIRVQLQLTNQNRHGHFKVYETLLNDLRTLLPEYPANKVLQVDYTYTSQNTFIDFKIKKRLLQATEILSQISIRPKANGNLEKFKDSFRTRYESREIPLLVALDPEAGIGYIQQHTFDSFLLNQLGYQKAQNINNVKVVDPNLAKLIDSYYTAVAHQQYHLKLEELSIIKSERSRINFPATSSLFFSQISDDQLLIKSLSGSSGINLFSRFADFDPELSSMAKEITTIDHDSEEGILAEVIHEPFARAGNIISAPDLRNYQIPYLSQAKKSTAVQIPLADIVVLVERGRIYLKSKKHDKLIRPMISHAYNYHNSSPLYRFLADLQFQDTDNLHFDFPALIPDQPFYPRLSYQKLIFSPATWFINWNEITVGTSNEDSIVIRNFLVKKRIPMRFLICEGDNELLIDQNHTQLLLLLVNLLKKRKRLMIKEFIHDPEFNGFTNGKRQVVNNEMVVIIINHDRTLSQLPSPPPFGLREDLKRVFSFGSEWLYFKIYCGQIHADNVLTAEIEPLIQHLRSAKLIAQYFFIRYQDPDPHIRLRLKVTKNENLIEVGNAVYKALNRFEKSGQVWKIQTDSYTRELERYGNSIRETEAIFCADSDAVLKLLCVSEIKANRSKKIAAGIKMTFDLISIMTETTDDAIHLCKVMRDGLKEDMSISYPVEKRVKSLFERDGHILGCFVQEAGHRKIKAIMKRREGNVIKQLDLLAGQYPALYAKSRQQLLIPYIHMSINRLFSNDQKFYEYLIYSYLFKYFNQIKNRPYVNHHHATAEKLLPAVI